MNLKILAAVAALSMSAAAAHAATLTFETAPYGSDFTGPVTEDGFTYSNGAGHLFVNQYGNPTQDMEGQYANAGGVLSIVKATPGLFTFDGLDYAAYNSLGGGNQTLTVLGFLGASLVETSTFSLKNTNVFSPAFDNWTSETNLLPTHIDRLEIVLHAGSNSDQTFLQAVDNVHLSDVRGGVPEPATWAMMLLGFGGMGAMLRARRRAAALA